MDEFDPFVGGAATATADSSAKPGAFDPFATGAAKAKPGPIFTRPNSVERTDPNAHWRNLYGGLEGLDKRVDVTQAQAFGALDKISRDPEEDRARAINQTFVANKLGMPDASLHANWDAVKSSFAKSELLIDQDKISDKTLYGWIGQRLNPPEDKNSDKGEIKPWTWTDTLVHDVGAIKREAARTWESIWKPLAELPAAPTNLPDVWINTRMNPLTDTPSGFNPAVTAGVYNGAIKPLVDGLLSPGGIATAGVGSGLGVAAESYRPAALALKGMSGVFAGIMADASIDSAAELRRLRLDPNSTTQEQITALSSSATSGIMALFGALHMTMESNPARAGKIAEEMQGKAPAEGAAVLREEANRVPWDQKESFISTAEKLDDLHKASGQPTPPVQVKAAAVLSPDGVITEGASHEEIAAKGVVGTEGFTLTNGEFAGRDHAYEIAETAGQLAPDATKIKNPIYRADSDTPTGEKHWTTDREAAELYRYNPGFGGPSLFEAEMPSGDFLEVNSITKWRKIAEEAGVKFPENRPYDLVYEEAVKNLLRKQGYVGVTYLDDFPDGAETRFIFDDPNAREIEDGQSQQWSSLAKALESYPRQGLQAAAETIGEEISKREGASNTDALENIKILKNDFELHELVEMLKSGPEGAWKIWKRDVLGVEESPASAITQNAGQLTPDAPKGAKELQAHMLDMPAKIEAAKAEAMAIEAAPAEELLSSVKKASVNAQLVRMGFEPITPTETKTWTEGVKGALERFEKDPERGANLVRRALSGDRRFSTDDVWDSQIYERRLKDEVTTAEKRYDEALKIGDPVAIDVADAELYEKQANLKQASQAFNEVMGSEAGRALNARKAMLREDYSLAALERKYRKSIGSADIPEDVQKQLDEKADKIAELEDALRKSQEQRSRARPPTEPRVRIPKLSSSILDRLSTQAEEARERLSKRAGFSASVIGDEGSKQGSLGADLQDLAIITADLIAKGVVKTAEISARLLSEFGDNIKPHIDTVIRLAKDNIISEKHVDYLNRRKTDLEGQIKKLTDKISAGDLATEGVKANRPSVEEIEKLEQKRDAARETLSAMREEAARISELEQAIAEKEQQIAEGDTKAKGKPANRPAKEQQEKLLRERDELNKQIAEARKEAAKPSAADKIADAVADIEQEIAAKRERLRVGDLVAKKQPINRPEVRELEIARQELDKVNTEIAEARKGPPASPEQMRSRDLDRQIAELERQIRTEEVFPEGKGEAPKSPEIAAKEKQLASLKEERNNIRDRLQPSAEPRTKEEAALKAWRTRTEKEIARLEAGIPKPESVPVEIPFTPEDLEKKKRLETLKRDFARDLRKNEEARRPLWLRGVDKVKWFAETSILTSLGIFLKIPVSAFWKTVTAPLKELAGTVAGKIFPEAAKYAPMQVQPTFASLLDTEGKAAKSTFTEGARAAGEAVRNRLTTEETLFVPDSLPPEGKDFVRSIHRALHLPAQINEFTRRVATIENNLIAAGKGDTLSDPAVWSTVRVRAYSEAYRAAYLEKDALLSGLVNATIRSIEQKGKKYNAESLAAIMTMVIEMDNPVKNVPVNIISQTGEAMTGSVIGTAQILKAYKNGFENMKPGDLDAAFRRVKNGTVGALAMVGAWYAYESIGGSKTGGSYTGQPDKNRKANEPKEGQVKVGDTMLPEMGFHNETWAAAQMIASYHHLLDEQYGKKTVETHADAFLRAALGPLKDVPGIKQSMIVSLAETKEPTKSLAQWTAARTIPAGVAQIARWIDTKGDLSFETFMKKPNQRFTRDAVDEFKVRIPGERETVPATKSQKKRDIEERLRK